MIYKILIKTNKVAKTYTYYQVQNGTEMVDYETEYLPELAKTYKALLATYTTDQLKLVHELEPELVVNITNESNPDTSI